MVGVLSLMQAEEITLTIGQAFDLAYKKFLESGGKDVETRKQIGTLQKRVCSFFSIITNMSLTHIINQDRKMHNLSSYGCTLFFF